MKITLEVDVPPPTVEAKYFNVTCGETVLAVHEEHEGKGDWGVYTPYNPRGLGYPECLGGGTPEFKLENATTIAIQEAYRRERKRLLQLALNEETKGAEPNDGD